MIRKVYYIYDRKTHKRYRGTSVKGAEKVLGLKEFTLGMEMHKCVKRSGRFIICIEYFEGNDATWLPFEQVINIQSAQMRGRNKYAN